MDIAVLINDEKKIEWRAFAEKHSFNSIEFSKWNDWLNSNADLYFDFLFEEEQHDAQILQHLHKPVFINSVCKTLAELNTNMLVRFNGWNTFINRNMIEAAVLNESFKKQIFSFPVQYCHDTPGFVSARVVAMIINEAYFALGEKISSKDEIDIAMKLGTNYPFGPFEWCEIIGAKNIHALLKKLQIYGERYLIAPALEKESQNN